MNYEPRFAITPVTLACAESVGAYRRIARVLPLPLAAERELRFEARVRIAHNSTWIENRTLALHEARAAIVSEAPSRSVRKAPGAAKEVRNYFEALDVIDRHRDGRLTERFIAELHAVIMKGSAHGRPRTRSDYRESNVRVGDFAYLPPAWEDVPVLMADLVEWANGPGLALPRYLLAGILAYQFVTIHPFTDGNGRACRALATWALRGGPDDFAVDPAGMLAVEEFYAEDLRAYYDSIQMGCHFSYHDRNEQGSRSDPDLTPWLDYFCGILGKSADRVCGMLVRSFETAHPDALIDPLADLPRTFRRLLARLPDIAASISAADVAAWLHVSDRTARSWLKDWTAAELVSPVNPDARRVHNYRLSPLAIEAVSGPKPAK